MNWSLDDFANIGTIISGLGVFFICIQAYLLRDQLKTQKKSFESDHERSRRELSVHVLTEWSKNLKKEGSTSRKIIEQLSEEQCRSIIKQEKVKIPRKLENLLIQVLGNSLQEAEVDENNITLTEAQTSELRWHAITYLNSLEFTLIAWQYAIVDRNIIEHQFSFLFKPSDGHELLKHFRKAAGGESVYPAIEIFCEHLKSKRKNNLLKKAELGQ